MEIRLGRVPGVSGLCKETQIGYSQGLNQSLFFHDSEVMILCGKNGMDKEKEAKDDPVYGKEKQV